jgi:hypothetical protein
MQAFLSATVTVLMIGSVVYFAIGFGLSVRASLWRRNEQLKEIAEFMNLPASEWFEEESKPLDIVVPFVRPSHKGKTRDQLRAIAKSRGLSGWSRMSKAELVIAIG